MKRIAGVLSLSAAFTFAAAAQAQTRQGFEIGIEGYSYRYDETYEGREIVQDRGRLFGLTVDYGRGLGPWELRLKGRAAGGYVDYESDEGDRLDDVVQATVQTEVHVGRPLALSPTATLTPFAGLGARGHGDAGAGRVTDTGLEAYDRYIFYAYAPVGAVAEFRSGPRTTVSLGAQYNLFLGGDSLAELSGIDPEAPDIELELEDGYGWELNAAVHHAVGGRTVSFGPFLRYWNIEESTHQTFRDEEFEVEFFEPSNTTVEVGLRLAYRF
jgi:hypothetical protein